MLLKELIGKRITNIYQFVEYEPYGLDKGECFVQLDAELIIDIPFGESEDVSVKRLNANAVSLFSELSDIPVYDVNKEGKSIKEIADKYQKEKQTVYNRLRKFFFGVDVKIKEYEPCKVEYRENKLKYIQNRVIVDFLWYPDDIDKGYILLDNGYIITETTVANHGTGLAGLNFFESIEVMMKLKGRDFVRITDHVESSKGDDVKAPVSRHTGEDNFVWCLVGNIIGEHDVEGGEKAYGTKHFSSNTKVYCFPSQWGDGYEKIKVIGRHRKSNRNVCIVMPSKFVTNWRLQKVYRPYVLKVMRHQRAWNSSDGHKEKILQMLPWLTEQ